ncbi:MAG TPA: hypothetical protein VKB84_14500, partial [Candidatus Binataceae bacterium]|nr:hypothetical protein [Candidatus Binataceae bacterium]
DLFQLSRARGWYPPAREKPADNLPANCQQAEGKLLPPIGTGDTTVLDSYPVGSIEISEVTL